MNNIDQEYKLPYNAPEINPFIIIAKYANSQAESAEKHLHLSIMLNGNTRAAFVANLPEDQNSAFSAPLVLATESLYAAIEAAIKARKSEAESLHTALNIAENLLKELMDHVGMLEDEIIDLKQQAENMRSNFTTATDSPILFDSSNEEAKLLLTTLEKIYDKYRQIRKNNKKINEIQTNLEYIKKRYQFSCTQLNKLEETQFLINERIRQTNEFLGISHEHAKENIPAKDQAEAALAGNTKDSDNPGTCTVRPTTRTLFWSYIKIILAALLLAFVIRTYVFDVTQVDGLSMYPTLNDRDDLINLKITYLITAPQRGDIVVFDAPDTAREDYVKRIIGLPNEEIVIERGMVYIDGELLDEPYLHSVYTKGNIKTVIPDGFYFVMGDNREISRDSRLDEVGLISIDRIKGQAVFRIYPFSSFGTID